MTVGVQSLHLGSLPGVRRHVSDIRRDLSIGRSCTWVVPQAVAAERSLDQLLEMLTSSVHVVDSDRAVPTSSPLDTEAPDGDQGSDGQKVVTRIEAVLDEVFGSVPAAPLAHRSAAPRSLAHRMLSAYCRFIGQDDPGVGHDPLAQLAAMPVNETTVVVIRADSEQDSIELSGVLQRYPVLTRDGVGPSPVLLVVGTPAAMHGTTPVDPLTTAVHWWWEVIGRLDVLTVATVVRARARHRQRELLDRLSPDLVPEIITEVAGPDLELAEQLGQDWDGTVEGLRRLVIPRTAADVAIRRRSVGREAAGRRPPQRLWEQWSTGHVAAWNGRTRTHLQHLAVDDAHRELQDRLWMAHVRALNPVVDDVRRSLADAVGRTHAVHVLKEVDRLYCHGDGFETIELNDLKQAADRGLLSVRGHMRRLLLCARSARNDLAHGRWVPDGKLRELGELTADCPTPVQR